MLGGFGATKPADDEAREVALGVKTKVEEALGENYGVYEPVSYVTQVVSGKNFKIKIKVGDNEYVHIKVWKKLPCYGGALELLEQAGGKALNDPL